MLKNIDLKKTSFYKMALPINFHGLQIERNFVEICLMGQGCSKKNLGAFYYVLARHEDF